MACSPNSRVQKASIVESHAVSTFWRNSAECANRRASRCFISFAAFSVNVMARIRPGSTPRFSPSQAKRSMRTRVLPEPGPATTHTLGASRSTAARWAGDSLIIVHRAGEPGEDQCYYCCRTGIVNGWIETLVPSATVSGTLLPGGTLELSANESCTAPGVVLGSTAEGTWFIPPTPMTTLEAAGGLPPSSNPKTVIVTASPAFT